MHYQARDLSIAPMPHSKGSSVTKREKFKWRDCGNAGSFMEISKTDLSIALSYQREEVSEQKIIDIAKSWDWRLFGALSVVMRKDGRFCVYDGGHRLRASEKRDDVDMLPCMVFDASDIKDEAGAFIGANTLKSSVKPYHKYRAAVVAEEKTALLVQRSLKNCDYEVSLNGKSGRTTKAIGTIMSQVRQDPDNAEAVLILCGEITDGNPIQATLLRPLFYLACNGVDEILSGVHRKKLIFLGDETIEACIQREKHIQNEGGVRTEAKAVVDVLNKGRRTHKIQMP